MKPIHITDFEKFYESLEDLAKIENSNLSAKELLALINNHYLVSKTVFSYQIKELQYNSTLTDLVQRIVEALKPKCTLSFILREIEMNRDTYYKKVKNHTFTRKEYEQFLSFAKSVFRSS